MAVHHLGTLVTPLQRGGLQAAVNVGLTRPRASHHSVHSKVKRTLCWCSKLRLFPVMKVLGGQWHTVFSDYTFSSRLTSLIFHTEDSFLSEELIRRAVVCI